MKMLRQKGKRRDTVAGVLFAATLVGLLMGSVAYGASWVPRGDVAGADLANRDVAMVMDPDTGMPHVAYTEYASGQNMYGDSALRLIFKYARWTGANWEHKAVFWTPLMAERHASYPKIQSTYSRPNVAIDVGYDSVLGEKKVSIAFQYMHYWYYDPSDQPDDDWGAGFRQYFYCSTFVPGEEPLLSCAPIFGEAQEHPRQDIPLFHSDNDWQVGMTTYYDIYTPPCYHRDGIEVVLDDQGLPWVFFRWLQNYRRTDGTTPEGVQYGHEYSFNVIGYRHLNSIWYGTSFPQIQEADHTIIVTDEVESEVMIDYWESVQPGATPGLMGWFSGLSAEFDDTAGASCLAFTRNHKDCYNNGTVSAYFVMYDPVAQVFNTSHVHTANITSSVIYAYKNASLALDPLASEAPSLAYSTGQDIYYLEGSYTGGSLSWSPPVIVWSYGTSLFPNEWLEVGSLDIQETTGRRWLTVAREGVSANAHAYAYYADSGVWSDSISVGDIADLDYYSWYPAMCIEQEYGMPMIARGGSQGSTVVELANLRVTVTSSSGGGVSNATVRLRPWGSAGAWRSPDWAGGSSYYFLRLVPAGAEPEWFEVTVEHPDYEPSGGTVEVEWGQTCTTGIEMDPIEKSGCGTEPVAGTEPIGYSLFVAFVPLLIALLCLSYWVALRKGLRRMEK